MTVCNTRRSIAACASTASPENPCQTLELVPGEYLLRLAVRDNTNGLIGTANGRTTVPAATAGQESKPEEKKP